MMEGNLNWPKTKRFFRCLHDALELFVDYDLFTHDKSRDYFTKKEVFRIFSYKKAFGYDRDTANDLTEEVLLIKKLFVGGSIDKLKDKEIEAFYKLVYDFRDAYFDSGFYEQIPFIKKVFFESKSDKVTLRESSRALKAIGQAFQILEKAYKRENIVYRTDDLNRYPQYLEGSQIVIPLRSENFSSYRREKTEKLQPDRYKTGGGEALNRSFKFLHHLFEGLLYPEKKIKGKGWTKAFHSLHQALSLFFYYKTYFPQEEPVSLGELAYRILEGGEIFISLLQTRGKEGFPLRNLDNMVSVLSSFFANSDTAGSFIPILFENSGSYRREKTEKPKTDQYKNRLWENFHQNRFAIPLLTRTLFCFSLDKSSEKTCKSEWGSDSSSPVVSLSFEDTKFDMFSDQIQVQPVQPMDQPAFVQWTRLEDLKHWIMDYKNSLLHIHQGRGKSVAVGYRFAHWLNTFFGWEDKRIEFGSFQVSENPEKIYQLLNYQAFLSLVFSSYLPENFFSSAEEKTKGLSRKTFHRMMKEITPVFAVLTGKKGYTLSWRSSFNRLFHFADSFLYSSNRDNFLSAEELVDLTVHIFEGIKTTQLAYHKVSSVCDDTSCSVRKILRDPEILAVYPRFQRNLFDFQRVKYQEKMTAVLGGPGQPVQPFDLLPLFLLIQAMELNYELIDTNKSFNLESDELMVFAKKFEQQLKEQIPYLSNKEQARYYLMYSFKTGNMPFFSDAQWVPLKFTNWYLNQEKRKQSFAISPNDFHFLVFDFYKLYQNL